MNCHMHQGNLFVNPYLGFIVVGPGERRRVHVPQGAARPDGCRADLTFTSALKNPEGAAARGTVG